MSSKDFQSAADIYGGNSLAGGNESQYAKVEWICSRKHRFSASLFNVKAGFWCLKCKKEEEKEEVTREVNSIIELNQGECFYNGNFALNTKIEIRCNLGHGWTVAAKSILKGNWCEKCYKIKQLDNLKQRINDLGGKFISGEYISVRSVIKFQCPNGHSIEKTAYAIYNGFQCKACTTAKLLNEVKEIARAKGGKCKSTEYLNNYTHLEFQCKNKHTFFANANNIKTGWWCVYCAGNAKLDLDIFQELAKSKGGELLTKVYVNTDSPMEWKCKQGHIFHLPGRIVKNRGKWCPHCASGKMLVLVPKGQKFAYTINDMQKLAAKHQGLCLSKDYKGSSAHLQWQCKNGHKWKAAPAKVQMGTWCKICRYEENAIARTLPLSEVKISIAEQGGKLLSTEASYLQSYPNIQIRCAEGHEWETNIKYINYGSWCPECKYDTISKKTRLPFSHYQKLVRSKGGKILSGEDEYENSRSTLTIKCKKGHVFNKICSLLQEGNWCLECE